MFDCFCGSILKGSLTEKKSNEDERKPGTASADGDLDIEFSIANIQFGRAAGKKNWSVRAEVFVWLSRLKTSLTLGMASYSRPIK